MIGGANSVIWDWNGTLLNDTHLSVSAMNRLLQKRNLNLLSESTYKDVFSFPVKDYYQKVGFDFQSEAFEIPAMEFIQHYNAEVTSCELHLDAMQVLTQFRSRGIRQFILSAMEQKALNDCLKHSKINQFFEAVSGLDNHYAASKLENGKRLIAEMNLDAREIVLIGDTIHDFEVAEELGCRCILISNGHQSKKVLQKTSVTILDQIGQLLS